LFQLPGTAYTAGEVATWLGELGLTVTATCGVRIFADYIPRERLDDPEFYNALLRLEMSASALAPYKSLARYSHLIAHKSATDHRSP
jgi:hypothetical protein